MEFCLVVSVLFFFYPIIKTTLLQNTTAIPQLPCSADNLCKHSVFFKREIFEAGLELMFSLRCLVTNQGLMPEISVAENPKKLGRALDLIFFVFYCWQNNKQKSQNVIFFFFSYTATCFKRMINLLSFVVFFFLLIPFVLLLESCIVYCL